MARNISFVKYFIASQLFYLREALAFSMTWTTMPERQTTRPMTLTVLI